MWVRDQVLIHVLNVALSNATNQSFVSRRAQLEMSDVEVSWRETSPACSWYIQIFGGKTGVTLRHNAGTSSPAPLQSFV